jgi:hypothetical protein
VSPNETLCGKLKRKQHRFIIESVFRNRFLYLKRISRKLSLFIAKSNIMSNPKTEDCDISGDVAVQIPYTFDTTKLVNKAKKLSK